MGSIRWERAARLIGGVLGLGLAVLVAYTGRPEASPGPPPPAAASARFTVALTGEFAVTPVAPRPFLVADSLTAGGRGATGSFLIQNQTGRTMAVDFHAQSTSRSLGRLLRVQLEGGGKRLAEATLAGVVRRGTALLRLPPGARRRLELRVWIPAGAGGHQDRRAEVSLVPTWRES